MDFQYKKWLFGEIIHNALLFFLRRKMERLQDAQKYIANLYLIVLQNLKFRVVSNFLLKVMFFCCKKYYSIFLYGKIIKNNKQVFNWAGEPNMAKTYSFITFFTVFSTCRKYIPLERLPMFTSLDLLTTRLPLMSKTVIFLSLTSSMTL